MAMNSEIPAIAVLRCRLMALLILHGYGTDEAYRLTDVVRR
jgi:hypothetical protein